MAAGCGARRDPGAEIQHESKFTKCSHSREIFFFTIQVSRDTWGRSGLPMYAVGLCSAGRCRSRLNLLFTPPSRGVSGVGEEK